MRIIDLRFNKKYPSFFEGDLIASKNLFNIRPISKNKYKNMFPKKF
jgi:hypothetical protein